MAVHITFSAVRDICGLSDFCGIFAVKWEWVIANK